MKQKQTVFRIIAIILALLLLVWIVAQFMPSTPAPAPEPETDQQTTSQIRHDATLEFLDQSQSPIVSIQVEIAEKEEERMAGLMGRTRITENEGMLFLFDTEEERSFWMANTPLPLDILFVNAERNIVKIHHRTQPYSKESLPSNSPAQFVVEVNAGFCDKYGIIEGLTVTWNRN